MTFSEILIGFAISYFAGNAPAIKDYLGSKKTLSDKIEACYMAALRTLFGIDQWHMDIMPYRFRSLQSLGYHLASTDNYDKETYEVLAAFESELRNNPDCYQYIIDMKIDGLAADIGDIKKIIQGRNKSFSEISTALKSVNRNFIAERHIERPQTESLYKWICADLSKLKPSCRIAALLGNPGTGKTVILADLVDKLEENGIPVIGLKSDLLFDSTVTDIDKAVNIGGNTLLGALHESAKNGLTVLIIDQMDALSLSLTTQRKPLAEVRKVIYEASKNPNIRVVFSCRIYDWENDLQLTDYDGAYIERLKELKESEVQQILKDENVDIKSISDKTIEIIRTPIYLSLFLKVCGNTSSKGVATVTELQKLYWDKILLTESVRQGYHTADLVALLVLLSESMVRNQSLVVPVASIPTALHQNLHFLSSNGFLIQDSTKVQFSHQTLFEYTYARLFCEKNKSIAEILKDAHQGIFLRNTIRRVLEYQRLAVEDEYVENVKLLLGVDGKGISVRYHLKQLVLTLLGSQSTILEKEAELLENYVFTNAGLMRTYARTVYAEGSIGVLLDYVVEQGGLSKCDSVVSDRIIQLLPNFIFASNFGFAKRIVLQYEEDYSTLSKHTKDVLVSCIRGLAISDNAIVDVEVAQFVLETLKAFDTAKELLPFAFTYRSLVRFFPKEVAQRLRDYVQARLQIWDKTTSHTLLVDHDLDYLVDELKAKEPGLFLTVGLDILDDLLQSSVFKKDESDIKSTSLLYIYNRTNSYHNFPESFLDDLLKVVENAVSEKWAGISVVLKKQSEKMFAINHILAITGWIKNIVEHKDNALFYLMSNVTKTHHSSSLTYYQIELFGSLFPHCSNEEKKYLVQQVMKVEPEWEKTPLKRTGVGKYPTTFLGQTKARFFQRVDEEELKAVSNEAWQALQEAKRKNFPLENEEPNKISVISGWQTVPRENLEKMAPDNLVEVAKKYNSDFSYDMDTPTMTGNAFAMRDMVAGNPDKMYEAYRKMIGKAELTYVTRGLEALLEARIPDQQMEELYDALFKEIGNDINAKSVSTSALIEICGLLMFYVKNNKLVPQILMDFVQKVAVEYHDEDDPNRPDIDYIDGINQVRGSAAHELVDCLYMDEYRESIITTIDSLADNASVATRCAVLFKLGLLSKYDIDRLLSIFLKLTADYKESLLKMPLHNLNPLNQLVLHRFDALKPYFEHCVSVESAHQVNVVWLWVATVSKQEGAKELMFQMADASLNGRIAIVNYIARFFSLGYIDLELEVLSRYMAYDEEPLGSTYDTLFMKLLPKLTNQMKSFFDDFFLSPACKYCRHYVYEFFKTYCVYDADRVLLWLSLLYEAKKSGMVEYDALTDVLLLAYNRILCVDKNSNALENAMNMLDELFQLKNNNMVSHLTYKLAHE